MSLRLTPDTATFDNGRIVLTRNPHGYSISYNGTNPETKYWPPRLTLLDRLRLRLWWRRRP